MRTQQQGLPLSPEFQEELARAFNRNRVQRRERLVDDQEVGVDEKTLEIGELLLIAERVGLNLAAQERGVEGDPAAQAIDQPAPLAPGKTEGPGRALEDLIAPETGEKSGTLGHIADFLCGE